AQIKAFQEAADVTDQAPISQLTSDLEAQHNRLSDPLIWSQDVVYSESDFANCFMAIMAVQPPQTDDLVGEFGKCVTLIDGVFTSVPERAATALNPWNLKALEAMRNIENKMVGRTNHFLQKGINLNEDPAYTAVAEPLKQHRRQYKHGLNTSVITADQTHEIMLNRIASVISGTTEVPRYVHTLKALSSFLLRFIPTA
ncbi:MAG: hypothetical protein AAGJ82_12340, partial [Bacteroidota bacterium]